MDPSRINKIEEIIGTLGTTFSSIKPKKVETPTRKEPKFNYVPKVPRPKNNPPIAKGVETVKTLEEIPLLDKFINETPIDFPPFGFIPRKLDDGWDPMIITKLNNFSCYALCDVGASTSVMPKIM